MLCTTMHTVRAALQNMVYTCTHDITIGSRKYGPPFLHTSIRQNRGGGLCAESWYFCVTTITDRQSPHGHAVSAFLLAVSWIKWEKNDKVSFDMTYSYAFKGSSIHIARFHSQSRTGGGGVIRKTKIPVQELWLKLGGSLYTRGGVFTGHYGTYIKLNFAHLVKLLIHVGTVHACTHMYMYTMYMYHIA